MLTPEQLETRKQGIGGSDAGAVLRLNPFKSPLDVYNDKLGLCPADDADNRFTYWGDKLEDLVASEYTTRTGNAVRRKNTVTVHPKHNFMLANVDRLIAGQDKILECKTANEYTKNKWGPDGSDEVPDSYLIQCMHYMIVREVKQADLAVLIGGSDFRVYTIDYNKQLADTIIEREHDFWHNYVLQEVPPKPYTLDELDAIYKSDNGQSVIADDHAALLHASLKSIQQQEKDLKDSKAAITEQLKRYMEDAQVLTDIEGNKLCTWKGHERSNFESARFKKAHPDLAAEFTKTSEVRPFKTY